MTLNKKTFQEESLDIMLHRSFVTHSERLAASYKNENINYAVLERYSNVIANILIANKEKIISGNVCIILGTCIERLYAVAGTIKAGMTYVPFDIKAPLQRNVKIAQNVSCSYILTTKKDYEYAAEVAKEAGCKKENIKIISAELLINGNTLFPCIGRDPKTRSYIIHTSGSTGQPKGVIINDCALINYVASVNKRYAHISENDSTCALQNFSFDASIFDMFPFMLQGAAIHFIPDELKTDAESINNFLIEKRITIQQFTTSLYHIFADLENDVLKKVFVCGEKMVKFVPRRYEVYNGYGPTEATVLVTYKKVTEQTENIPIGDPIDNTEIIIVREDGTQAATMEKGEICISGICLAEGYLNLPEETAKRFVPNINDNTKRMYKTGDIGMYTDDGELLCFGRMDFQIKHRGYRIELDEIKHYILELKEISDCAILFNDRTENKYIVCFYCTYNGKELTTAEFNDKLKGSLAEYMMPSRWIHINAVPMNNNGKTDRNKLFEILESNTPQKIKSNNTISGKLRSIWAELLDIQEDFDEKSSFGNLGGHSILSMLMLRKVKDEIGITVSFQELLTCDSFKDFISLIQNKTELSSENNSISLSNSTNANLISVKLRTIWADLLDISDDFDGNNSFENLGGHSILSMLMLRKVKDEIGITVSFQELLTCESFNEFSSLVKNKCSDTPTTSIYKKDFDHRYDPFVLSAMQQAYYVGRCDGISLGSVPTHLYLELDCFEFDHSKFVRIINKLLQRHDALRLRVYDNGTQQVLPYSPITEKDIPYFDIRNISNIEQNKAITASRKEMVSQKCDYANSSLVKLRIFHDSDTHALVQIYLDGFVADGWSQEILFGDFDILYGNEDANLPNQEHLFRDYVLYCVSEEKKASEKYAMGERFWQENLDTLPDVPELPLISDPQLIMKPEVKHITRVMYPDEWKKFEKSCADIGISTSNAMVTIFGKVIARWSRKKDLIISLPVASRFFDEADFTDIFGICTDFLLFDIHDYKDETLLSAALRNQERLAELSAYRDFTGMDVIRELSRIRGDFGNAAPVVFTSLLDVPDKNTHFIKKRYFQTHTSQIWLDAIVLKCGEGITFSWDYVGELFEDITINAMMDTFFTELKKVSNDNSEWNKKELDIITAAPMSVSSCSGEVKPRVYKPLIELLLDSEQRFQDNTAVCVNNKEYSYKKLFSDAKVFATLLSEKGIRPGDKVMILLDKCYEQIVSVVGTVLSGAVYVPVDTENTRSRLTHCIQNSEAKIIVTDNNLIEKYGSFDETETINITALEFCDKSSDYVRPSTSFDDIFCIIYTSGTTGLPKGAMILQKSLQNCIDFTNEILSADENTRVLSLTNLCHDMSIYDIFGIIQCGGSIILPDNDKLKDPSHWSELMNKYNASLWNSVPSIMEMLLEHLSHSGNTTLPSLKNVILGGETLSVNMPEKIRKYAYNCEIYNVGGPTETTIWSIAHKVEESDLKKIRIPLGRAIDNVTYVIFDDNFQICPYDVSGMICIEGVSVSNGYIGLPEKNAESFVTDPYTGKKMYITGDIGKYLINGEIDILGREDFQVKLNGKRIELTEIENASVHEKRIDVAVAVCDQDKKIIGLYYKANSPITAQELEKHLESELPPYMMPSVYMEVDSFPLTRNGKIAREQLPEFEICVSDTDNNSSDISEVLLIYREILGRDDVSSKDNFFRCGGDSLKAIRLLYELSEKTNVNLQLTDIFEFPVIGDMQKHISSLK